MYHVFILIMNKNTDMPFKRVTFTLPPDTIKKLEKISKEENRNKSNMVAHLIDIYDKD